MATSTCAKLREGVTTSSAEETRVLAAGLAAELPADVVLALHGDMGVGKTTFVQGLARGFGVKEQVTSPTFAIYSVYQGAAPGPRGSGENGPAVGGAGESGPAPRSLGEGEPALRSLGEGGRKLVHLDAYRLEHERQLEALLLEEFLTSPWCLAVEWPEKVDGWLPPGAWHVTLSIVEGERHRVVLR